MRGHAIVGSVEPETVKPLLDAYLARFPRVARSLEGGTEKERIQHASCGAARDDPATCPVRPRMGPDGASWNDEQAPPDNAGTVTRPPLALTGAHEAAGA